MVCLLHVIELVEELEDCLPVRRHDRGLVPAKAQLLEFELRTVVIDRTQKLGERFAVRVHVDEDETTPGVDLQPLEMDVVLIKALTPILTVDDFGVAAIEIVLPAEDATQERSTARREG